MNKINTGQNDTFEKNIASVAVIIACYNRYLKTKRCIESLFEAATYIPSISLFFYIWDDGTPDDSIENICKTHNNIEVFRGPGNYFWSKSMYCAMREAIKHDHDLYLMVNDDVEFYPDSLQTMINSYYSAGGKCGVVGSTRYDGRYTYGGRDNRFNIILPSPYLPQCYYANWNCFLIDRYVIEKVGLINPKYKHATGDYDYSCRMRRKGLVQYVASDYVGECINDHEVPSYFNPELNLKHRLKEFFSSKGLPIGSYFRFHWVDKRIKGIIIALYTYPISIIRSVFPKR